MHVGYTMFPMLQVSKRRLALGFSGLVVICLFVIIFVGYDYSFRADESVVHIAISCCGDRKHEAAVLIKSAIMLTRTKLVFHIFTEPTLHDYLIEKNILKDIPSVLYVDTDVIFLSPPEDTWSLLFRFNSTQFAAMAPEQMENGGSWYDEFNDTLKYGPKGINSGVMLMNLTRLRLEPWDDDLVTFLKQFKPQVRLGDQDLLNIYFHFYPEKLYLAPCEYNYRSDYCWDNLTCTTAAKNLHGNRQLWQFPECNPFRAVYRAIKVHWDTNVLPFQVCTNLNYSAQFGCGNSPYIFVEELFKRFLPDVKLNETTCT